MKKILTLIFSILLLLSLCIMTSCDDTGPDNGVVPDGKENCQHEWYELPPTDGGNCEQEKHGIKRCTLCYIEEGYTIPQGSHNWEIYEQQDASCSYAGYVRERCSACNELRSTDLPGGHTYTAWTVEGEPTKNYRGWLYTSCSRCSSSKEHELPAFNETDYTLEEIDQDNFKYNYTFEGITYTFEYSNFHFMSIGEEAYAFSGYGGTSTSITIPKTFKGKTVTSILNSALANNTTLISVTVPDSITQIDNDAFADCTNLESVVISGNIRVIANSTFKNCAKLKNITIPNSVLEIENFAFEGCTSLENVTFPNQLTYIGRNAFKDCVGFTEITLPSTCTTIWLNAFKGCNNVTEITLPRIGGKGEYGGNTYHFGTIFGSDSQYNQNDYVPASLKKITVNGDGDIPADAFSFLTNITEVVLEDGIKKIGNAAFYGCSSLNSVRIPNTIKEVNSAFRECGIEPSAVDESGKGYYLGNEENPYLLLFDVDYTAKEFTIHPDTKIILSDAFDYLEISSLEIPEGIIWIGSSAFTYCSNLKDVYFGGTLETWFNYNFGSSGEGPLRYAERFYMKNEADQYEVVTEIAVPESITKINPYTFHGLKCLETIIIHGGVEEIGDRTFLDCTGLSSVIFTGTMEEWVNMEFNVGTGSGLPMDEAESFLMSNGEGYVEVQHFTVPDGITEISKYKFYGFNNMFSVVIPASVSYIASNAFDNCGGGAVYVYFKGTAEQYTQIANAFTSPYFSDYVYFYLPEAPTLDDLLSGNKFWHYNADGEVEIWEAETSVENKGYEYVSTTVEAGAYWAMLNAAEDAGMLEAVLEGEMLTIYTTSASEDEFEAKLADYYKKAGTGISVLFSEGYAYLSQNDESTDPIKYVEYGDEIYYVATGTKAFDVDSLSGNIYECIELDLPTGDKIIICHYYNCYTG